MEPSACVEAQARAYNRRDLAGFVACYSPDIVIENAGGETLMRGHAGLRSSYGPFFEQHPELRADILQRIEIGQWVIDKERVDGAERSPFHAVAIYHVSDGLIDRVRFLRE